MSKNGFFTINPLLTQSPWFNAEFLAKIDTTKINNFRHEALTFTKAPLPPYALIDSMVSSPTRVFANTKMNLIDPDSVNCAYGTAAVSYTSAAGGFPLGDLNWFPARKTAWIAAGKPTTYAKGTEPAMPAQFSVEQNYPNPFNPSTMIKYQVAEQSRITLTVFDMLGREAAALVNGIQNSGTYSVQWNASAAASGVYFYAFRAVGTNGAAFSETKKIDADPVTISISPPFPLPFPPTPSSRGEGRF